MSTIIARHQGFLHTDCDRLNSAKSICPTIWPAGTEKSSSSTPLVARVTHRARQRLTSHPPPQPASPGHRGAGVMASPAREVSVSAGPVSTICSEPPPPASVSRERTACPAPLVFLPIFTLSQTQRRGWGVVVMVGWGGWKEEGEQQRDVAHRSSRTTEEAGKIHLFILPLSVKSLVHFLNSASAARLFSTSSAVPASHFVLLSPEPLIPPPLVLPHTHSLIPNLFFPLY